MIVTAAGEDIPQALVHQLKEGDRLAIPVGHLTQTLMIGVKEHEKIKTLEEIPVRFVPLIKTKEKKQSPEKGKD